MATVGPTAVLDLTEGGCFRLNGDLAAGTTLATGNIYRARVKTGNNVAALTVRVKCTVATTGGFTVQIVPVTPDVLADRLDVSDVTTSLSTGTVLTDGTEGIHTYTAKGEQMYDIVVDASASSGAGGITYCDLFGTRV